MKALLLAAALTFFSPQTFGGPMVYDSPDGIPQDELTNCSIIATYYSIMILECTHLDPADTICLVRMWNHMSCGYKD